MALLQQLGCHSYWDVNFVSIVPSGSRVAQSCGVRTNVLRTRPQVRTSTPRDPPARPRASRRYDLGLTKSRCSPIAGASCPMSAVTIPQNYQAQPAVTDTIPDGCLNTLSDAPTGTAGSQMVVLSVPEPTSCMQDFAVQIWSHDTGHITAVKLLTGSP